jgi:hypothetical protein
LLLANNFLNNRREKKKITRTYIEYITIVNIKTSSQNSLLSAWVNIPEIALANAS